MSILDKFNRSKPKMNLKESDFYGNQTYESFFEDLVNGKFNE